MVPWSNILQTRWGRCAMQLYLTSWHATRQTVGNKEWDPSRLGQWGLAVSYSWWCSWFLLLNLFFSGGSALLYLFLFRVCSHGLVAKDWKEKEEKQISVEKGWKSCYLCIRCVMGCYWSINLDTKKQEVLLWPICSREQFSSCSKKNLVDLRIWCAWPIEFRNLDYH